MQNVFDLATFSVKLGSTSYVDIFNAAKYNLFAISLLFCHTYKSFGFLEETQASVISI